MGGLAFAADGLSTPRMPPQVYSTILARAEAILRAHFNLVGHALEAPAKTSHGDVDVLVAEPLNGQMAPGRPTGDLLTKLLGARTWKRMSGNSTYNLALPWPEEFKDDVTEYECEDGAGGDRDTIYESEAPAPEAYHGKDVTRKQTVFEVTTDVSTLAKLSEVKITSSCKPTRPSERYIQVDVNIMPTAAYFNWHIFYQAHGDFWSIIGGIVRRFGLTVSSKGLSVRIAEVEKHNKEQSRVLATNDPDTVLEYMGLDIKRYWLAFKSWDEMLEYVTTCRFHNPAQWKFKNQKIGEAADDEVPDTHQLPSDTMLKHNDRQRAAKRPLYGYWIETYLPAHVDDEPGRSAFLTREEVADDAKQFFGSEYAQKFEERKRKMVRQIGVDKLWAEIRRGLPVEGTEVGYVMKGMKREIVGHHKGELPSDMIEDLELTKKAFAESTFDDVLEWARANWKEVGERQKKLDQAQSSAHLLEKRRRDGLKGDDKNSKTGRN
ncbi:hypothetical protein H2200_009051 [Cladophialophora chaetospira]|uniref:Uncharacterized protein n=1 Tax=Cladophialophora chaetospira TaxID=386627 RepID=A0AA38X3H2_9EURO|nr:hypothetical protein H2200_009051 [Cladophialophora chaetospira]